MQPIPLVAGRFESPYWRSMGLGDAGCPDIAPYPNLAYPGRCTNIPTDQQNATGNYATSPSPVSVAAPPSQIAAPVNQSIVDANAATRFGLQLTPDRATQDALAAEVIAQAAKRGLPASCHVETNTAPAMLGIPGFLGFAAYCSINGGGEDSAAQLLLPGHIDVYQVNNPSAIAPLPVSAGTASTRPSTTSTSTGQPLPASAANLPASTSSPAPGGFDPSAWLAKGEAAVDGFASQFGVPSWAVLAAAAAAAFFVFGGKR